MQHDAADGGPLIPSNAPDAIVLLVASSPAVKGLSALTVFLYLLGKLVPGTESVLAIKATNTYGAHSYVWNVFTASFFNTSLVMTLLVVLAFVVMGRFLIPPWTSTELLRFVSFVSLASGVGLFFAQIIAYMVTFSWRQLDTPVSGGMALIAALAVTVKQRLPSEPIQVFGQASGLTAKDVPACVVLVAAAFSLVDVAPLFLQALLGAYFGWLYLRFLQRAADGMRGDMSDHMAFIMFFPPALQPLMQVISSFAYKAVCGKAMQTMLDDLPAAQHAATSALPAGVLRGVFTGDVSAPAPPLPGSNAVDAERRRIRALKTLEERLRSITQEPSGAGSGGAGSAAAAGSDAAAWPKSPAGGEEGAGHAGLGADQA